MKNALNKDLILETLEILLADDEDKKKADTTIGVMHRGSEVTLKILKSAIECGKYDL